MVLSTIEKRYRFSSLAASMIIAVFDFSVVVSVVFISYFGHKSHKPRWLGIALIIQGIGAFIFALPQFIFGEYLVGSDAQLHFESCDNSTAFISLCNPANNIAYGLFILGNILIGIGGAPLFTIGTSFIDDIVYPKVHVDSPWTLLHNICCWSCHWLWIGWGFPFHLRRSLAFHSLAGN